MILELIIGLILFVLILNIVFSFVPIPRGILGTLVALLIVFLVWRLVF
jgi:hypothetical protein